MARRTQGVCPSPLRGGGIERDKFQFTSRNAFVGAFSALLYEQLLLHCTVYHYIEHHALKFAHAA